MRCLVTCGPTYEKLDEVRRLTNFSTGKLGIGLANHLLAAGHEVTLLKGYYATCKDPCAVPHIEFSTTEDLLRRIQEAHHVAHHAVFHAAAVSDFQFGSVFRRTASDELQPLHSGKFKTQDGNLFVELVPTPKVITHLREFFPDAKIFGWKYEVEGTREDAIALGRRQIRVNQTNFCVVNGAAYGNGYGLVGPDDQLIHCQTAGWLYDLLLRLLHP